METDGEREKEKANNSEKSIDHYESMNMFKELKVGLKRGYSKITFECKGSSLKTVVADAGLMILYPIWEDNKMIRTSHMGGFLRCAHMGGITGSKSWRLLGMKAQLPSQGLVSFSLLQKDVGSVVDFMERLKNEGQKAVDFEEIMNFERKVVSDLLRSILCDVEPNMGIKYDIYHVLARLRNNIDFFISSRHRSKSSATMTKEQLNFLLLNLHCPSEFAGKTFPLLNQYEIIHKVCNNMRDFLGMIVSGCIEHEIVEYVLPLFQLMAERVGCFLWNDRVIDGNSRAFKLAHLLMKIIPIELEVMHTCYTNLKASTSAEVGRFIKLLPETTTYILREYLIHLQEHMVSTLVRHLEEKSRNEESIDETSHANLDLLENIELLKEDLKHVYLKAPDSSQCCFPMSDGLFFMHLLHIHLNDLLDSNSYSIALIKKEIGLVKEELEFIRSFFVNIDQERYKDLWTHVLDVTYEAKNVIDSIIIRDNGLLHLIFSLPITMKKIRLIKEDVYQLPEKIHKNKSLIVVNSPKNPVEGKSLTAGKIIVGFEEDTDWIISKLTSGPKDLDVISITGMPSSGKTTLAYKVYNYKSVARRFDINAWCIVGQEYDKRKLLEKVYNQVTGADSKLSENIDVADELRRHLFGKRYLVVLDDLWDTDTWYKLIRPFPLVENGSRIILTSREIEVALYGKRNTDPLKLRLLKSEESWELLEKRAFGEKSCPGELLDVGKEIAKNCKGLPLVADLIAGVIAGREKKKSVWLEVRNNLNSFILNSEVEVMKVIELSYDHLPHQLKPCFLHFASIPKDNASHKHLLKMYWLNEGLVERTDMKSVEEVTEVYLDNLISCSLVISFNEIGSSPTCQLHDLVHDFRLIKAKEEKLFERIISSAPSSSSDLMPRKVTVHYYTNVFGIHNFVPFGSKKKRCSSKHLYSLSITGDKLDNSLSDICHLRDLRLLRVLELYSSMVKHSLLNEICMLNHLRALHIVTEIKYLPLSFSNLSNLESLMVENDKEDMVLLPGIWDLVNLRVLSMDSCSFLDMDTEEPILITENIKLKNLRILDRLMLSYSKDTVDIFKRFPNLQQLIFILKESWDYSTEGYWFPRLNFLNELEILKVEFKSSNSNHSGPSVGTNRSWDFLFPLNLKVLDLHAFPLTSESLSTIARLTNLEELALVRTIIVGEERNMGEEDTFENKKYLGLESTLSKWEFLEESFPMLEKLELQRCHELFDS
ncbi:hypothetical protein BC332_14693 [Capsicum chinense]|nr:hypothetical protein BC332_14693 [Capsicum chinense]